MEQYKYYCLHRPPDVGAVPLSGLLYVEAYRTKKYIFALKTQAWGYAVYNRCLTADEIEEYELMAATEVGEE